MISTDFTYNFSKDDLRNVAALFRFTQGDSVQDPAVNRYLKNLKELDVLFEKRYEDNVNQKINDARFAKMSQRYEAEQGENAKKIKVLRLELKKSEGRRMDVDTFLETVRRYSNATEIT